jgi:hypothetical protein
MISEEKPGVVVPATMPEVLLQREEPSLEAEKTLLREKLDKEELAVQGPRPRVRGASSRDQGRPLPGRLAYSCGDTGTLTGTGVDEELRPRPSLCEEERWSSLGAERCDYSRVGDRACQGQCRVSAAEQAAGQAAPYSACAEKVDVSALSE